MIIRKYLPNEIVKARKLRINEPQRRTIIRNNTNKVEKSVFAKEKQMNVNEYQELAMTTLNPELSKKEVLINSVMGLCGESGEAIDIVKKWMAQGHELDKEHLAKELGDIAWYLAEAATALDIPLEDILQANIDKLKKRYPEGFETKRSLVRLKGDI